MKNFIDYLQDEKIDGSAYIHHLFENQKNATPDAVAVIHGDENLTYQQLHHLSSKLAADILTASPNSILAGISTYRCIEMIVGLLAILKAGKAFLPLDPTYPEDRLKQIITDSGIDVCLSVARQGHLFKHLPVKIIATDSVYGDTEMPPGFPLNSLAYVLYTSGSTGVPKGVSVGHAGFLNLLAWQKKNSISSPGVNTLQFTALTFDVSLQEIFTTLTTGGTLVIVDNELRLNPMRLLNYIQDHYINRLFLPFVALQYLTDAAGTLNLFPQCLKEIMCAGEQLKITPKVAGFFNNLPGCTLFNQYGPTEASCIVTQLKLEGPPAQWPFLPTIGKAIDNVQILILDENQKKLPDGETGELCITGVCLANGYLNRPELTAEKFIDWGEAPGATQKVYRTGDLARYLPDGNIAYLGRMDTQVKIRGNRVELGEIEVALSQAEDVHQAVVIAKEDHTGSKVLIAFVLPKNNNAPVAERIGNWRVALQARLPEYMVPTEFVVIDQLPVSTAGKVDRKALLALEVIKPVSLDFKEAVSPTEKIVLNIWKRYLNYDKISITDSFFDLGGHSIIAIMIVTAVSKATGKQMPISALLKYPTIEKFAGFIDAGHQEVLWNLLVPIKPTGSKTPIYLIHGDGLNVLAFTDLASYLDKEQPVYGMQAKGLNGVDEPAGTLQEITSEYVKELIRQNPDGPYILAGYSYGGYIAVEMHRQLTAMGKKVKMLIMLDTEGEKSDYKPWSVLFYMKSKKHSLLLLRKLKNMVLHPGSKLIDEQQQLIDQRQQAPRNQESEAFYKQIDKIAKMYHKALRRYQMEPFDDKIYLFKAKINVHHVYDKEFLGWKKYAKKGVEKYMVPGNHLSIMLKPNVKELAAALQKKLDETA
jgi:amino acid adenylation domain-containing protein